MMKRVLPIISLILSCIIACGTTTQKESHSQLASSALDSNDLAHLDAVLASQPEDVKMRYAFRHPRETLSFFGIEPGDNVIEVLPGNGWYSRILSAYIGREGNLIGVDYNPEMWAHFGGFATPEFLSERRFWAAKWITDARSWEGNLSPLLGYEFGQIPSEITRKVDAVLFIRALHHLVRFDDRGDYVKQAMDDVQRVLRPGGIVGIVQHRAPKRSSAKWADGANGYLKEKDVIKLMEQAGFEFVAKSEINANPADKPKAPDDSVWRLPPRLRGSENNPELRQFYKEIGESDRMTLMFRKP